MKRFYIAVIILLILLVSSIYLTENISQRLEEILIISETYDNEKICDWWQKNEPLLDICLSSTYTDKIEFQIMRINTNPDKSEINELITIIEIIKNRTEFNFSNVF